VPAVRALLHLRPRTQQPPPRGEQELATKSGGPTTWPGGPGQAGGARGGRALEGCGAGEGEIGLAGVQVKGEVRDPNAVSNVAKVVEVRGERRGGRAAGLQVLLLPLQQLSLLFPRATSQSQNQP